jgi:CRISP-associated protein Cas1
VATLYITEQHSIVRKTGDRLIVEKDKTVLLDVPCLKLEAVLIYGNVQVTTQALVELLDHGIELAILSRGGKLRGQLTPPKAKNVPLRMRQYEVSGCEDRCLPFSRELVCAKIANGVAVLRRFRANHPDALTAESVADLERFVERCSRRRTLPAAPSAGSFSRRRHSSATSQPTRRSCRLPSRSPARRSAFGSSSVGRQNASPEP